MLTQGWSSMAKVFGLAGTDHLRRDLTLALMWGMPVALAFGLLAAVGILGKYPRCGRHRGLVRWIY